MKIFVAAFLAAAALASGDCPTTTPAYSYPAVTYPAATHHTGSPSMRTAPSGNQSTYTVAGPGEQTHLRCTNTTGANTAADSTNTTVIVPQTHTDSTNTTVTQAPPYVKPSPTAEPISTADGRGNITNTTVTQAPPYVKPSSTADPISTADDKGSEGDGGDEEDDENNGDEDYDPDDEDQVPSAFGLEGLAHVFDKAKFARWVWPKLTEPSITHPTTNFTGVVCTGELVDLGEIKRASRNLEHFCNHWAIGRRRMYVSTSDQSSLYFCSFGGVRNCSLALWEEANDYLNRECGNGGTGYVYLNKLRIGRDQPFDDIICSELDFSPLKYYRIRQRATYANGMLYDEWKAKERIRKVNALDDFVDVNAGGNDEAP